MNEKRWKGEEREDGPWHFQQYLVEAVVVCLGELAAFAEDKILP